MAHSLGTLIYVFVRSMLARLDTRKYYLRQRLQNILRLINQPR